MLFPAMYKLGVRSGVSLYEFFHAASNSPLPSSPAALWQWIVSIPMQYSNWWWNLVADDPLHVVVETTLLLSIVYMAVSRNTEGYKQHETERLTKAEQEDLLYEWKTKGRAPLAPPLDESVGSESSASSERDGGMSVVVHKQMGRFMDVEVLDHRTSPTDTDTDNRDRPVQTVLNFASFDFWGMQSHDGDYAGLRAANNDAKPNIASGTASATVGDDTSSIKAASKDALNKYGCGSCGPRGFYGTIDTHLELEDEISKFTDTQGAIMYSDGASTCSSTVAAFAKRGDLLVVDEGVYEPILTGVLLSRATVKWFKHNDMEDLERVLLEVQQTDRKLKRAPNAQRRFIVVEGLYKNLGTICPLDQLVKLKHKYSYRLILDESFSFGTLGATGKGALQLHNQRPMYDAEIVTIALENSLGSIGGVTVGNEEVVDHQRLSGAGYCFSASAPPFTASAAIAALHAMKNEPDVYKALQENIAYMYSTLKTKLQDANAKLAEAKQAETANSDSFTTDDDQAAVKSKRQKQKKGKKKGSAAKGIVPTMNTLGDEQTADREDAAIKLIPMVVTSDERSPIVVVQFEHEIPNETGILNRMVRECLRRGVAVVSTGKQIAGTALDTELAPAIRMTVTALHTKQDVDTVTSVLCDSLLSVCRAA